jgi:hypothetical protein
LSQDDCLVVPFDKEELCNNSLIIPLAQLSNQHDASNLEPEISTANKHIITIGNIKEEMRLVSSLNTLGYIEFNDLCNLNNLKEKCFMCNDLAVLSRNKFHTAGQYNYEGEYIIHHVYICSNLISPFNTQYYDKVDDCTNANHALSSFSCSTSFILTKQDQFQEGEPCTTATTTASIHHLELRMTHNQEGENDEIMHMFAALGVYIEMSPWPPPFTKL